MRDSSKNETFLVVRRISEMLSAHGGTAMLVGGCVRDSILGVPGKDYDIEVYGLPMSQIHDILSQEFQLSMVGASFGVLKISHYNIDISLPRVENKTNVGHKGFDISFVPDLSYREASSRRDFTINAIMQNPLSGEIIDPWNGIADLHNGLLRHISPHFSEDPLRVLRAMQFSARFNFQVAEETVSLCSTLSQNELPPERIAAEWEKMLIKGVKPSLGLVFLRKCKWIDFYPELAQLIHCEQNPLWHPEGDVWNHTLAVLDAAVLKRRYSEKDNMIFMLSALCHDFGKPLTTKISDDGRIISPGHAEAGLPLTEKFIHRLWRDRDYDAVIPLVANHMNHALFMPDTVTDRAIRRLSLRVKSLSLLADLAESDIRGCAMPMQDTRKRILCIEQFRKRTSDLHVASMAPKPIVMGRHLIERGLRPGICFKIILEQCFEAQLDGKFNNIHDALSFLDSIIPQK